jgi:hypothetical protein
MARWHNIRVRGDLYEMVAGRAQANRRSVAQMTDVLLTQALQSRAATTQIEPVLKQEAISRAPVAQRIEGQMTVDEMLASCPQCAGELQTVDVTRGGSTIREGAEACVDCGWVREPK